MQQDTKQDTRPKIIITFKEAGSAQFEMTADGVTPLQVFIATHFLSLQTEAQIMAQMSRSPSDLVPARGPISLLGKQ